LSIGYIYLRVILPQGFPLGPPYIRVIPNITHPWVNVQMYVAGHPKLAGWNMHNNLGQIVKEVADEFIKNPPRIIPSPAPQTYASNPVQPTYTTATSSNNVPPSYGTSPQTHPPYGSLPNYSSASNLQIPTTSANPGISPRGAPPATASNPNNTVSPPTSNTSNPPPKPERTHTPQPVIPTGFPQLENMQLDDLERLLNDDDEFYMFFETLDQVKSMQTIRDDLMKANEDTARKNLSFQQELEQKKSEVEILQANIKDQRNQFDQQAKRQQEISKRFTSEALLAKLTESINQSEQNAEDVTTKFLNKEIDSRDFIKTFSEKKKLYHLRAAKKKNVLFILTN